MPGLVEGGLLSPKIERSQGVRTIGREGGH